MLTAEAVIRTDHPGRYLLRLGKHASKVGPHLSHRPRAHASGQAPPVVRHAEWSATSGTVTLDWGRWTMQAAPGVLTLRAEAADEQHLRRIQDMLTARLEKLGNREHLTVSWQPPASAAAGSTQPG
jgi:hypothetical protein